MAETNDRQQELEALHRSYKMMEMDRQKYSEESQVRRRSRALPPLWVVAGRGHALGCSRAPPRLLPQSSACGSCWPHGRGVHALWSRARALGLTVVLTCNVSPCCRWAEHHQAAAAGD